MSINYCTLASNTVDSFCSPRRGIILNRLIAELHPVVPSTPVSSGNGWAIRDTAAKQILGNRYQEFVDDGEQEVRKYEHTEITVKVDILGLSGSDTIDVSRAQIDFVAVTNLDIADLKVDDVDSITINITDFEI